LEKNIGVSDILLS